MPVVGKVVGSEARLLAVVSRDPNAVVPSMAQKYGSPDPTGLNMASQYLVPEVKLVLGTVMKFQPGTGLVRVPEVLWVVGKDPPELLL